MTALRLNSPVCCVLLVALAGVCGSGCGEAGPERLAASGEVTLDGKPLETGSIAFLPAAGTEAPSVGGTIENGRYELPAEKGALVGKYNVRITSMQKTGKQIEAGSPEPPGTMVDEVKQVVPPRYNTETELTAEVTADGENTFDFKLESAAGEQ